MKRQLSEKQLEVLRKYAAKKGEVRNPKGKVPGTLGMLKKSMRELLKQVAENNLDAANKAINDLLKSDNQHVRGKAIELYLRLLEFTQPRLSAMAVKTDGNNNQILIVGKPADLELPASSTDAVGGDYAEAIEVSDTSTIDDTSDNLNDFKNEECK